jgi:carbon-monoxide dehydrogenase small subunit
MSDNVIQMTVNGSVRQSKSDPDRTLLNVLREDLGLTGAKDGCSQGDCGACVVLVNGRAVNSCMMLAPQAQDCEIVTIEGLGGEAGLHPLQKAFAETWAFQCGFCTPGMLMSCFALLQTNDSPSREEILSAVSGNFCRCTGYQAVVKAVEQAAAEMQAAKTAGRSGEGGPA